MPILRANLFSVLLCIALPTHASNVVELSHWWVSDGERASIDVIRRHVEARGIVWHEQVAAGSGTRRYMDVLGEPAEFGKNRTLSPRRIDLM